MYTYDIMGNKTQNANRKKQVKSRRKSRREKQKKVKCVMCDKYTCKKYEGRETQMTDFERDEFAVVDCLRGIRHSTWYTWSRSKISTTYREMKIALHRFFPLALRVDSYHSVPFQFAQSTLVEARNPCQSRG